MKVRIKVVVGDLFLWGLDGWLSNVPAPETILSAALHS